MVFFNYLLQAESKYIDSTILDTSDIRRIIPHIVVNAATDANGFTNTNIPKNRFAPALISINGQLEDAIDFRLSANCIFITNCIINHEPIIIPKNWFNILGSNIKNNPITYYKI